MHPQALVPVLYITGYLAKKSQRGNSLFLQFFPMHIHVFILCRKFELIPIKFGFLQIFKVAQKLCQIKCPFIFRWSS
uniref:Uncharacterized protein n=1 Tax=Amphimedon queenslandica TaxID=400682 RepID=A0A1X7T626_AMPQE